MSETVKEITTKAFQTRDGKVFLSLEKAHDWADKLEARRLEELKTDQDRLKPIETRA